MLNLEPACNEEKCSAISFKPRSSPLSFNYHLNGKQISSIAAQKDLGLFVSADLTWRSHYQLISSRAYKMLGLLRRVFSSSVSVSAKRSLYISLVCSKLLYCSSVWHPYLLVDIKNLEYVQRRATKFIASNPLLDYRIPQSAAPDDGVRNCSHPATGKVCKVSIRLFQYTRVCPVL